MTFILSVSKFVLMKRIIGASEILLLSYKIKAVPPIYRFTNTGRLGILVNLDINFVTGTPMTILEAPTKLSSGSQNTKMARPVIVF